MCDMDLKVLKAMFNLVRLTARHGKTTGMFVNKLWARFKADNWDDFSVIDSSL